MAPPTRITTTTTPRDTTAPRITDLRTDRPGIAPKNRECGTAVASATVVDASSVTVVLFWRQGVAGTVHQEPMDPAGRARFAASIGPVATAEEGDIFWWVTATDAGGNAVREAGPVLAVRTTCAR